MDFYQSGHASFRTHFSPANFNFSLIRTTEFASMLLTDSQKIDCRAIGKVLVDISGDHLVNSLVTSQVLRQQLWSETGAIFAIRRGVAYPRQADLDRACGDQKSPFCEVSIGNYMAKSLSIDTPGVSVEELLNLEINGLLDHISRGLADVGINLAGILKRLLKLMVTDGAGLPGCFDVTFFTEYPYAQRWAAEL